MRAQRGDSMAATYRRLMDAVYYLCVVIAGVALVLISAVIPWGVYTRYILNSAASWPEPAAVLLTIWLTFFGAAACYRLGLHMNVSVGVDMLPGHIRRVVDAIVELLMAIISGFIVYYGIGLVQATWYNTIGDFPFLSVGITYLPIPIGSALTLLFILEHVTIGRPVNMGGDAHSTAAFE
jgi:TRAP-type C4-dicarboxylate transport system permease small subunit